MTHFEGRLAHLESDLRELDRKFHHLESVFDRVEHNARFSGGGHIHGNTAHVKRLLESIEDSIHHMRSDVADLRRRTSFHRDEDCYHHTRPVYRNYYGSYGSRSHLHGGVGFFDWWREFHGSISGSKCGFFNCPLNGSFEHLGITEVFFLWVK